MAIQDEEHDRMTKLEGCFEGRKVDVQKKRAIDNLDEELAGTAHTQTSLVAAKKHR